MRTSAVAALFLMLCAAAAFSQQSRLVPRRLLLVVGAQQDSRFTQAEMLIIARSVHQRLQDANADLVIIDSAPTAEGTSANDLSGQATRVDADAWLQILVGGDWTATRLEVKAFDLLSRTPVASFTATRSTWVSLGGLSREPWTDVTDAVAGKLPMRENTAAEVAGQNLARLTISALPGSVITGAGKQPVRVGQDGTASVMIPPWHEYVIRVSLAGYVPATQRIFLSEDRVVSIAQKPSSRWAIDFSVFDSRAPGIDVTMAAPEASFFLRLGFATYAAALSLDGSKIFRGDPLTYILVQAGRSMSPEDGFFGWYLALGAVARVLHEGGTAPILEPIAPLGVQGIVGIDLSLSDRSRLFLEYTPSFYMVNDDPAFRASLGREDTPGWLFSSAHAINLLSFRLGLRWHL